MAYFLQHNPIMPVLLYCLDPRALSVLYKFMGSHCLVSHITQVENVRNVWDLHLRQNLISLSLSMDPVSSVSPTILEKNELLCQKIKHLISFGGPTSRAASPELCLRCHQEVLALILLVHHKELPKCVV